MHSMHWFSSENRLKVVMPSRLHECAGAWLSKMIIRASRRQLLSDDWEEMMDIGYGLGRLLTAPFSNHEVKLILFPRISEFHWPACRLIQTARYGFCAVYGSRSDAAQYRMPFGCSRIWLAWVQRSTWRRCDTLARRFRKCGQGRAAGQVPWARSPQPYPPCLVHHPCSPRWTRTSCFTYPLCKFFPRVHNRNVMTFVKRSAIACD